MHSHRLDGYRGNYEVGGCVAQSSVDIYSVFLVLQTYLVAKTEKLKNQQREYEAQLQYRQHLQVSWGGLRGG